MDILSYERSLYKSVVSKYVLLAGLAGLSLNGLLYGVAVSHLASLETFDVCRAVCDGHVSDSICEILEVRVARHEVSLTSEANDDTLASLHACLYGTLGGLTVSSLSRYQLTLLADDADCLVEVSLSFLKGLLAVHHTGRSHLTQLHYVCCCDCHSRYLFLYMELN